jgi:molecular chaperone GrpE
MTVEGQQFDPKFHDAVACICTLDHPEHTIIGEVLRGYQRGEEVIRPAKVAVAVPPENEEK